MEELQRWSKARAQNEMKKEGFVWTLPYLGEEASYLTQACLRKNEKGYSTRRAFKG